MVLEAMAILQMRGQGEGRLTQVAIEKVIGMTHTMFKHIIALNTYTEPFLSMRANDQRELIEQLLGITQLSDKAELLKDLIKNLVKIKYKKKIIVFVQSKMQMSDLIQVSKI